MFTKTDLQFNKHFTKNYKFRFSKNSGLFGGGRGQWNVGDSKNLMSEKNKILMKSEPKFANRVNRPVLKFRDHDIVERLWMRSKPFCKFLSQETQ